MSNNSFKDYLITIGQYPLLTAEQELELGRRIKEEGDKNAREQLINSNLRLVVYIAKQYKNAYISIEDLVAEGNLGLISAVDKYDYTYGFRFSTCATPWIKQAILKALTDKGRAVRLPAHIYQQLTKMKKFIDSFNTDNGREPTRAEIAKALGIDESKVNSLFQWKQDAISIDMPLGDEEKNTIGDTIADPNDISPSEYAEKQFMSELIQKMIAKLPARTQIIMKMRYGLGNEKDPEDWKNEHTLEEIGAYLGITRERVRQIEKETIQNLKLEYKGAF